MSDKYEIKVTAGEYAGQWVCVPSLAAAIEEFGSTGFERSSFRESVYYQVILHDPEDGDVVWMNDCNLEQARREVSGLYKQGRSAEYKRYHYDETII